MDYNVTELSLLLAIIFMLHLLLLSTIDILI
ncbi:hypothetical protein KSF78_0004999 [Schistosoma japonicum]|nr:hypothetical protein KSF78_0004999 [Schistosoma japonicum]